MKISHLKIIDSHFHFYDYEVFDQIAVAAGYVNSEKSLHQAYEDNNIVHGVVMGNGALEPDEHTYPAYMSYCVGLDRDWIHGDMAHAVALVEENLKRRQCCGIKLYPGYNHVYVSDPVYDPIYELARKYDKPVAIHTGLTATANALLKYSHPLTLDEAAVKFPDVQLVMCHIGNPFLQDAIAVLEKNHNVAVDVSGLLEGKIPDMNAFLKEKRGYINMLSDWFSYLGAYDRIMFGTDWPLANLRDYIAFVKVFIPERYWEDVFFNNANTIYRLGLKGEA